MAHKRISVSLIAQRCIQTHSFYIHLLKFPHLSYVDQCQPSHLSKETLAGSLRLGRKSVWHLRYKYAVGLHNLRELTSLCAVNKLPRPAQTQSWGSCLAGRGVGTPGLVCFLRYLAAPVISGSHPFILWRALEFPLGSLGLTLSRCPLLKVGSTFACCQVAKLGNGIAVNDLPYHTS